jgi:hypothetical protein
VPKARWSMRGKLEHIHIRIRLFLLQKMHYECYIA